MIKNFLYNLFISTIRFFEKASSHFYSPTESAYLWRTVQKRSTLATVKYIEENMPEAVFYYNRNKNLNFSLSEVKLDGLYLEFGVAGGDSINFIAKKISPKKIFGFDSFEGLHEDWAGYMSMKKVFDRKGTLPRVENNVELIKGYFDKTLAKFIKDIDTPIAFLHIDSDLYSSCVEIFKQLEKNISINTIIVFDEYFNYPGWKNHEFKAFQEFVKLKKIKYEYLSYAGQHVTVRILEI